MNAEQIDVCFRQLMLKGSKPDAYRADLLTALCEQAKVALDLLEALTGLLADITEYQTINKLGGENNHWQVRARAAIAKATS